MALRYTTLRHLFLGLSFCLLLWQLTLFLETRLPHPAALRLCREKLDSFENEVFKALGRGNTPTRCCKSGGGIEQRQRKRLLDSHSECG